MVDLSGSGTGVVARRTSSEVSSVLWFVSAIGLPVAGFSTVGTEVFTSTVIFLFLGKFLKLLESRGCICSIDESGVG